MMLDILHGALYVAAVAMLVTVLCICVYDIIYTPRWREFNRQITKRLRTRPHITVLIYVRNDVRDLGDCLRSIRQNRYKHCDVVVADNSSSSSVRKQTKNVLRSQAMPVYYYANRHKTTMEYTYRQAYKRSKQGELVLLLTSQDTLVPGTLKSLAVLQSMWPKVACFYLSFSNFRAVSLETVVNELGFANRGAIKKIRLLAGKAKVSLQPGVAIRREAMLQKKQPLVRSIYVSRLALVRKRMLVYEPHPLWATTTRGLAKTAYLSLFGICTFLAVTSDVDQPLILLWALVAAWTIILVIQLDTASLKMKAHLLAVAFLSVFVYIAVVCVQAVYAGWNLLRYLAQKAHEMDFMREFSYKSQ